MACWATAAAAAVLALFPQHAQPIRCSVTVCNDDGVPLQGDRCLIPRDDRTEQRDCDAFGHGYDRCQRIHVRDPRGEVSGIPAVGAYFYRCAKSTEPATFHCGDCDARGMCADDYSSDGFQPTINTRFWCCDSAACNDPARDLGLSMEQYQFGWTYQQSAAAGTWDDNQQCAAEVIAAAEIPLFELSPQQMGECTTLPLGDGAVQAWAGAQAQTGQYLEWQSMCVACDVGSGRLGHAVATHYFYRDLSCSAFSVSKISHYGNPEQCDWDPDRQRGFVSSCELYTPDTDFSVPPAMLRACFATDFRCRAASSLPPFEITQTGCNPFSGDTPSTCRSPALDGLIVFKHVDGTCGLANRMYHVALPAEEVVASTDAGLCLPRGSATQSRQQLFDNLPAGVMGVRACCQQDAAFIYFYADQSCTEYGLPPEHPETELRRGLRFSLNSGCERKEISPIFSELWVSAECTSSFGATCPPLIDDLPPTLTCPNPSNLDIAVDYVARLRRDNLVDAFLEGSLLPDASEQHEVTAGTVAGGGVPLIVASAVDRQDFIFQTLADNAIRTPIRTFARLASGPEPSEGHNVTLTDTTRYPVGTSTVFFEAEDMSGDVATCAVGVTVLDICEALGNYCGEHGVCQPDTGDCICEVDLQVEQVVCGGGTACDGAGDGPCNCDPCAGCSDGSTKWTGVRCEIHPVGNVQGIEKKSRLGLFLGVSALLLITAAAVYVGWRRSKAKRAKAAEIERESFKERKKKVYADVPSFKLTGEYGQRPESFLTMAMKAEEEQKALAEETKRKERLSKKGEVVVRADTKPPKKKKKKKKASSQVVPA